MKSKNKKTILYSSILKKISSVKPLYLPYIIYIVFSFVLVSIWFHNHTLLAYAEQGLHLYNLQRTISVYNHIWLDIGFGIASPFYVPRIPYYSFLSGLFSLGIANWIIQASIYFVTLLIGLFSVARLVTLIFKENKWYLPHLVAIFYLFNLYVMSQILIRFIDALLLGWALLPLFIFLWINWIRTSRVIYLACLLIGSFIFSAMFTLVSSLILLWIPLLVYSGTELVIKQNKKKIILTTLLGLVIWIICNLWWLMPVWGLKDNSYAEMKNSPNNLISLNEVSQYYNISDILLLRQEYFFNANGPWSVKYTAQKFFVISYVLLLFCIIGVIASIRKKEQPFILILFIIAFFLIKGTDPPFGKEIFNFLFTYIPFTQVIRNPYEKLGLLFVLPYIIFSSYGITVIAKKVKRFEYVLLLVVVLIFCFYLVKPMLSENFFPLTYDVTVPNYYLLTNNYIKKRTTNRLFSLPYLNDSTVHYDWGYVGEEPSEFLFDNESLSKTSHIPSVDAYYLMLGKYLPQKNFPKLLELVNSDTIVMHNDFVNEPSKPDLKMNAQGYLQSWKHITNKKQIGQLDVYSINKYKVPGIIYTADKIFFVGSLESGFDEVLKEDFNIDSDVFMYNSDNNFKSDSLQKPKMSFKKLNNENYLVNITNATKPFVLVLSMTYNNLWTVSIKKRTVNDHFEINGFENGWLVNKKGSYEVNIVFNVL